MLGKWCGKDDGREGGVTKYYGKTLSAVENFFAVDSDWLHRHKVRLQRVCMYISG